MLLLHSVFWSYFMTTDIETIIYTEDDRRITVSNFDDGVFLGLQAPGSSSYISLSRDDALKLLAGLIEILGATA
jgi:hypothetical protein